MSSRVSCQQVLFIKAAERCFYGPSRPRAGVGVGIRWVVLIAVSEPFPENSRNPCALSPPDRGRGMYPPRCTRFVPHLEYVELERCGHEPWRERHARNRFLRVVREWVRGR